MVAFQSQDRIDDILVPTPTDSPDGFDVAAMELERESVAVVQVGREIDALVQKIQFLANSLKLKQKPDMATQITTQVELLRQEAPSSSVLQSIRELAKAAEGEYMNVV